MRKLILKDAQAPYNVSLDETLLAGEVVILELEVPNCCELATISQEKKTMTITITVSDEVARHLNSLSLAQDGDINEKLRLLLIAEYRRRLTHYSLTNRQLTQKYKMSFEAFERQQITKQHGYTWDVESDAIAWETAADGIRTMDRQLAELAVTQ